MKFYESTPYTQGTQQVALVDIDETICCYPNTRRYDLAEPIHANIDKIKKDLNWSPTISIKDGIKTYL